MLRSAIIFTVFLLCISSNASAQSEVAPDTSSAKDSTKSDIQQQLDVSDVWQMINKSDSGSTFFEESPKRYYFTLLPTIGFALATGLSVNLNANASFYLGSAKTQKLSSINSVLSYTQYSQVIWLNSANIWSRDNRYCFQTEARFYKYPTTTYGLGSSSTFDDYNEVEYYHLRLYHVVYKKLLPSLFVGPGYHFDYHWDIQNNITNKDEVTAYEKYYSDIYSLNQIKTSSLSSGVSMNLLYDNRLNSNNPMNGAMLALQLRANPSFLGSDVDWQSVLVDARKYFCLSQKRRQVLAFWAYEWLTFGNKIPYFDLPSTGWDQNWNTGRAYAWGRYRGTKMLYFETEYRFDILKSGLLGGVLFANVESFPEWPSNTFQTVNYGKGFGLRVKLNKHSNTNVAIDYAFGELGSQGLFFNLNEVF